MKSATQRCSLRLAELLPTTVIDGVPFGKKRPTGLLAADFDPNPLYRNCALQIQGDIADWYSAPIAASHPQSCESTSNPTRPATPGSPASALAPPSTHHDHRSLNVAGGAFVASAGRTGRSAAEAISGCAAAIASAETPANRPIRRRYIVSPRWNDRGSQASQFVCYSGKIRSTTLGRVAAFPPAKCG